MPNDPFGAVRTGFNHWGHQLQVATAPHRRKFVDFAVDQAIGALPEGPMQKAAKLAQQGYKRYRSEQEYESTSNKRARMVRRSYRSRGRYGATSVRRRFSGRRYRRRRATIRRPVTTLWEPARLIKMKAMYTTTNAGTSGALGTFNVSGVNCLDPFLGSSAQQCLGSDQWAGLYNRCKVLGCEVKFRLHNKGTTAVVCGITPLPESNALSITTWDQYTELPGTVKRMLSPDDDTCVLWKKMNTKRWLKIANLKDEEDVACTFATTAPTRDYTIPCWFQSMDKSTTNAVELMIEVTYTVYLFDRVLPTRS